MIIVPHNHRVDPLRLFGIIFVIETIMAIQQTTTMAGSAAEADRDLHMAIGRLDIEHEAQVLEQLKPMRMLNFRFPEEPLTIFRMSKLS
jgi:hypothetical protein